MGPPTNRKSEGVFYVVVDGVRLQIREPLSSHLILIGSSTLPVAGIEGLSSGGR